MNCPRKDGRGDGDAKLIFAAPTLTNRLNGWAKMPAAITNDYGCYPVKHLIRATAHPIICRHARLS